MRDDELTKQSFDFAVTIISLVKILKEKHESIKKALALDKKIVFFHKSILPISV